MHVGNNIHYTAKSGGTLECKKLRTISIMSQVTNILLRVIQERERPKIKPELSKEQFGLVSGKGTRNAIFCLRTITERTVEVQKNLYLYIYIYIYICFVDYEKFFKKVKLKEMFNLLSDSNTYGKKLRLIQNLYQKQKAAVRVGDELSVCQEILGGARQGCFLSPDLFNIYNETILRTIEDLEGLKIGGRNFTYVRYADATTLIADFESKLQCLIDCSVRDSKVKGVNVKHY